MADEPEDGAEECLHCCLIEAIDEWAIHGGQVDESGAPHPNMGELAQGLGECLADIVAMAPSAEEAGLMFRAIMASAESAYPQFRRRYREAEAAARPEGIHGMLESATFKGKPN